MTWGSAVAPLGPRRDDGSRPRSSPAASRGIGRAVAVALARRRPPGRVLLLVATHDGAKETAGRGRGGRRRGARGAGRRRRRRRRSTRAFTEIEAALGPVELLVNNAGITARRPASPRMSDEQWDARAAAPTSTGAFHTIRRATPKMMRARFGRIVNVSSVSGQIGPGRAGQLLGRQGRAARPHPGRRPGAGAPAASPATSSPPGLS